MTCVWFFTCIPSAAAAAAAVVENEEPRDPPQQPGPLAVDTVARRALLVRARRRHRVVHAEPDLRVPEGVSPTFKSDRMSGPVVEPDLRVPEGVSDL